MADLWYPLSPKFNILGMDEPLSITSNIKLPKPVVASIAVWLSEEDD